MPYKDEEIIEKLWRGLGRIEPVERGALALRLFGKSGIDILNYLFERYGSAEG